MRLGRALTIAVLGAGMATGLLWLLGMPHQPLRAADLTVCPAGPPTCGYATIQAAVDVAQPGDRVKIAAGVYSDLHARPSPSGYAGPTAITQVAYVSKTLILAGGYTTTNWTTPDPAANPATLDAGGGGRGIVIAGDVAVTLSGLRVTGGDATGLGGPSLAWDAGGGVYALATAVTISDSCVFSNVAEAGAGLYLRGGEAIVRDSTVISNAGSGANLYDGAFEVDGNVFAANRGSGLYLADCTATVSDNEVFANASPDYGGGILVAGGAVTLTANTVYSNTAGEDGGGIHLNGSHAVLYANHILSNTAGASGAGLASVRSYAALSGNTIASNAANGDGGGIFAYEGDTILSGNTISANVSGGYGGGGFAIGGVITATAESISWNDADGRGGGLYLLDSAGMVTGSTFASNTALSGGGIDLGCSNVTLRENVLVSNTVSGQGGGLYLQSSHAAILSNTFASNVAAGGGGLALNVSCSTEGAPTISGNNFVSNTAREGGAVYIARSRATLSGNAFVGNVSPGLGGALWLIADQSIVRANLLSANTADWGGGGAYLYLSSAVLTGNLILSNTTLGMGGGMLIDEDSALTLVNNVIVDNQAGKQAGGMWIQGAFARLYHNTIARNAGRDGSGILVRSTPSWSSSSRSSTVALTNTVLVSQTIGITVAAGSTATLNGVLWYGLGARVGGAGRITVANEITGSPAFAADGYSLTSFSAAIDAGVEAGVSTDVHGDPRDAWPDLGADEYVRPALGGVTVAGPTAGAVSGTYTFTAAVVPASTALPVTHTWEATDHAPVVHLGRGTTDSLSLSWDTEGIKTITVTAANAAGAPVSASHILTLYAAAPPLLLSPGWNLSSLYVEPFAPTVSKALVSISGRYDRVLGERGTWDAGLPEVYNTLHDLNAGLGYYIRVTGTYSVAARVEGTIVPVTTPLALHQGWNWIGYLPEVTLPISEALASIEGSYQYVHSMERTYAPGQPGFSTLWEMKPGEGYLIYADHALSLTYPSGEGAAPVRAQEEDGPSCGAATPTPFMTVVYGQVRIAGVPAAAGTQVEILTPRGEVAGCGVTREGGLLPYVHVYGEDATAMPPIPGFRAGEALRFRVNGDEALPDVALVWQDDRETHTVELSVPPEDLYLPLILLDR